MGASVHIVAPPHSLVKRVAGWKDQRSLVNISGPEEVGHAFINVRSHVPFAALYNLHSTLHSSMQLAH